MANLSELTVTIFSYNRASLLDVTLKSITQNLPGARVVIYDDLSDDPFTVNYLETCDCDVVYSTVDVKAQHGNLYGNMQRAFDECQTKFLLFLQDDTQVVRKIDDAEFSTLCNMLFVEENYALAHPTFMKQSICHTLKKEFEASSHHRIYTQIRNPSIEKVPFCWADVCLICVDRLRSSGFTIQVGEGENEGLARKLLGRMPYLADPFVFYCPEVPTFRNRSRPLSGKIASKVLAEGQNGYTYLNDEQSAMLRERPISEWPFAEDFLEACNPKVKKPFVYQDFSALRYLKPLAKVEYLKLSAKRRLKRLARKLTVSAGS